MGKWAKVVLRRVDMYMYAASLVQPSTWNACDVRVKAWPKPRGGRRWCLGCCVNLRLCFGSDDASFASQVGTSRLDLLEKPGRLSSLLQVVIVVVDLLMQMQDCLRTKVTTDCAACRIH